MSAVQLIDALLNTSDTLTQSGQATLTDTLTTSDSIQGTGSSSYTGLMLVASDGITSSSSQTLGDTGAFSDTLTFVRSTMPIITSLQDALLNTSDSIVSRSMQSLTDTLSFSDAMRSSSSLSFIDALLNTSDKNSGNTAVASLGDTFSFSDLLTLISVVSDDEYASCIFTFFESTGPLSANSNSLTWTQGQTDPLLLCIARTNRDHAIDLTHVLSAQLVLHPFARNAQDIVCIGRMTVLNARQGIAKYEWNVSDVATIGSYQMFLRLTYNTERVRDSYPVSLVISAL